jgi:predicted transcriptional regulator of viral defense system
MYETIILEKFSSMPVFSLADVSQITKSKAYAKSLLSSLLKKGKIKKIKRDLYTLHEDAFLVATFIIRPSYISSISALSFYGDISQIPNEIFCFTNKLPKTFHFIQTIRFFHTNFFFGFEEKEYKGFKILVADREKAIIDSIGKVPIYVFEEALEKVNPEKMLEYVKKIGKKSLAKRIGYLLEKRGYDVYSDLKSFIDKKFVFLDPIARGKKKNEKWRVLF